MLPLILPSLLFWLSTNTLTLVLAAIHVPSYQKSYRSMPAMYYGMSWSSNEYESAQLQFYDIDDWCQETFLLDPKRRPNATKTRHSSSRENEDDKERSPPSTLPIALLVNDPKRGSNDPKGFYPCHLVDYERLATLWNAKFIIFYDPIPNRPISYITSYLDDPILSVTNNTIGFQLVSYETGMQLRELLLSSSRTRQGSSEEVEEKEGEEPLLIQLDGRPATNPPKSRFLQQNRGQRIAVHIIPKLTGLLSLLGSLYIIYNMVHTKKMIPPGSNQQIKMKHHIKHDYNQHEEQQQQQQNHPPEDVGVEADNVATTASANARSSGNPQRRRQYQLVIFHRLLLGLSVSDIFSSLAYFLSHWMIPTIPPDGVDPDWYNVILPYTRGNKTTCNIQVRRKKWDKEGVMCPCFFWPLRSVIHSFNTRSLPPLLVSPHDSITRPRGVYRALYYN